MANKTGTGKHWLDYIVAAFALIAAAGTGLAAYYSAGQLRAVQDTARRQLRAYVFVDPLTSLNRSGDDILPSEINFKNYGVTPAFQISFKVGVGFTTVPIPSDYDFSWKNPRTKQTTTSFALPPNSNGVAGLNLRSEITKPAIEQSISAGYSLILFGTIEYLDMFEEKHFSNFCIVWDFRAGGQNVQCERHQEAN
jgi:hypothetical protein